jgi:transcriptional regulator with XRE-family HTH domain
VKKLKSPYSESFPVRLRNFRLDNGFTQKQLGTRWNVSPESISAWEVGRRKPPVQLVPLLIEELEIDRDELIEYISGGGIQSQGETNQKKNYVKIEQNSLNIRTFKSQHVCESEILREAHRAKAIKVLTIRGDKYFVGTKSIFHPILEEGNSTIELLVLSPWAEHITEELASNLQHKSAEEIRERMRMSLDYLMGLDRRYEKFSVRCYHEEPIFKLLIFDDVMFVSSFAHEVPKNDEKAEMFIIQGRNALFLGFEKHFDELLKHSVAPESGG